MDIINQVILYLPYIQTNIKTTYSRLRKYIYHMYMCLWKSTLKLLEERLLVFSVSLLQSVLGPRANNHWAGATAANIKNMLLSLVQRFTSSFYSLCQARVVITQLLMIYYWPNYMVTFLSALFDLSKCWWHAQVENSIHLKLIYTW